MTRRRNLAVWTLLVLATLLTFVCSLIVWVDRQMLDNSAWTRASRNLIADPSVRSALSVYLVNELYDNVNVADAFEHRLPKNLKPLASPAAAALRQPAVQAVGFMLARERVQNLWVNASAQAHRRLVNVLENKTGYGIATGNGVVTLDLGELVRQLGTELGLPAAALDRLPHETGRLVLMRSSQLSLAQTGVQTIRALSLWLLVLVLVLYAAAVYVARGARRTALRRVAWSFVLVGVLLFVVRKVAGNYVVDALANPAFRVTGHHVWLITTDILGQIAWAAVFYGLVMLLGVTLAGPTRPAREARRAIAPVLNDHQGIAWGVAGFAFLLLVLWGGTHALRTWWGVILIGALIAAGVAALRRQTLAEAAAVDGPDGVAWRELGDAVTRKVRPQPRADANGPPSAADELARLSALHERGVLSDEEFARAKALALQ
jgi:hypothetical protein